jgi:hypothetical protein
VIYTKYRNTHGCRNNNYLLASNGVFFLPACIPASEMDPLRAQCAIGLVLDPLLQGQAAQIRRQQKSGRWVPGLQR